MKFIPLLIAFFIATPAFAGTVTNPVYVNENFTPVCEPDETFIWFHDNANNGYVDENGNIVATDDEPLGEITAHRPCGTTFNFNHAGEYDYQFSVTADGTGFSSGTFGVLTVVVATTTVGGGISFIDYADITPTDMLASVRQGTIDTADKTLPLLVFLGIPLGFLLVLFLIGLINKTLTPETSLTSRRGNGRGWTAHGVMEHDLAEFKKKERSRIKRDL